MTKCYFYSGKQREEYWNAVNILRSLIIEGISRADLMEEIEEDLCRKKVSLNPAQKPERG